MFLILKNQRRNYNQIWPAVIHPKRWRKRSIRQLDTELAQTSRVSSSIQSSLSLFTRSNIRGSAPVIDLSSHPVLTAVNISGLPLFPSRNFTHTYIDTQSFTTYVCNHLHRLARTVTNTQSHIHMVTHTQSHSQAHMYTHTHTHTHTSLAQCTS